MENKWPPYAWYYGNKFISPQWCCFPNKPPHFRAGTHEVESTNLLNPMVNFVVTNGLTKNIIDIISLFW